MKFLPASFTWHVLGGVVFLVASLAAGQLLGIYPNPSLQRMETVVVSPPAAEAASGSARQGEAASASGKATSGTPETSVAEKGAPSDLKVDDGKASE